MQIDLINITLPEGTFKVNVSKFNASDITILRNIYAQWRAISNDLKSIGGRGVNLPEVLSEGAFCMATGAVRLNSNITKANTSFDVFDLTRNKRIQIKACSVLPDLTSFGPDSVWDELYFVDFFRQGLWDGSMDFYLIPNDLIYNHKVNSTQTMKHQQLQGRRPRFSIFKDIIQAQKIKPAFSYIL